jgi:hypothetical protein
MLDVDEGGPDRVGIRIRDELPDRVFTKPHSTRRDGLPCLAFDNDLLITGNLMNLQAGSDAAATPPLCNKPCAAQAALVVLQLRTPRYSGGIGSFQGILGMI